nr:hypothetical protein CFP56_52455 [Quercus suber]
MDDRPRCWTVTCTTTQPTQDEPGTGKVRNASWLCAARAKGCSLETRVDDEVGPERRRAGELRQSARPAETRGGGRWWKGWTAGAVAKGGKRGERSRARRSCWRVGRSSLCAGQLVQRTRHVHHREICRASTASSELDRGLHAG